MELTQGFSSYTFLCLAAVLFLLILLFTALSMLFAAYANLKNIRQRLINSEKKSSLVNMVAGVTHDINTSVGVALSAVTFLQDSVNTIQKSFRDEKMKRSDLEKHFATESEALGITILNLQKVADLVKSFKRISVDQSNEMLQAFKLKDYIGEVLLSLNPKLRKTGHLIEVHCDESIKLNSYPGALSQVLTNLIDNSLIHAFRTIKAGKILIEVQIKNEDLELRFSDNGEGMDNETRERIFEPFFTTLSDKEGTGLGLYIVHSIVKETLGGRIHCESTPEKGTVFTIVIPLNIENRSRAHGK